VSAGKLIAELAALGYPVRYVSPESGVAGVATVNGRAGTVNLTKSDVALANADNTSDANKPVSTAQAAADSAVAAAAAADATSKANAAQSAAIGAAAADATSKANAAQSAAISAAASDATSKANAAQAAAIAAAAADATAKADAAQAASVPLADFATLVQAQVDEAIRISSPPQAINVFRFDSTGAGPYSLPALKPYDTTGWNLLFMGGGLREPADYTLTAAQLTLGSAINNPATFPKGTLQYTVLSADITPDGFAFDDVTGAAVSSVLTSNPAVINGITAPSPVSVTGGEYSINSGTWTATPGSVVNGDSVRVRQTSSASGGITTTAVLTVGGVSASFAVTTLAVSPVSPELVFMPSIASVQVAPGSTFQSNAFTVDGFASDLEVPISVAGPAGTEYCVNYDTTAGTVSALPGSRAWTSAPGVVKSGDIVRIRQVAPATNSTLQSATMTVGGTTATFSLVTDFPSGQDGTITFPGTPNGDDPNVFPTVTNATPGQTYTSNTITIAGLGAGVSIGAFVLGGEYRKNGGAWNTDMTTVTNGDTIQLRMVAPPGGAEIRKVYFRVRGNERTFEVRNALARSATAASNINWSAYGKLNVPIAPYINQARRGPAIAVGPVRDIERVELPGAASPTYASDYFYVVPPGGGTSPVSGAALVAGETVFYCPADASSRTSGGTQYSRTEMRELIGETEATNWGVAASGPIPGTHVQEGILRVTQFSTGVPINGFTCGGMTKVTSCVAQIHGVGTPDMVQVRASKSFSGAGTVCSMTQTVVAVLLQPNGTGVQTSYPTSGSFAITDGSHFAYKITVENNTVRVQLARNLATLTGTFPFGAAAGDQFDTGAQPISNYTTGFYFKAGNYLQDIKFRYTGDVADNIPAVVTSAQYSGGGEVVYRLLNVSHA